MKKILFTIGFLFLASQAKADPTFANQVVRVTSMSFVAPTPAVGAMLITTVRINGGVVTGITGGGVTWTRVVMSSANRTAEIWAGANSTGPVTPGIVVSTNAGAAPEINYTAWAGMPDRVIVETFARTSGTSATPTMGPITVMHNKALVIAKTSWGGNRSTVTQMTANGFTDLGVGDAGLLGRQGYKILSASDTSLTTQVTISASDVYDGVIAAFVPKEGLIIAR